MGDADEGMLGVWLEAWDPEEALPVVKWTLEDRH